jgi:hypothetical protein
MTRRALAVLVVALAVVGSAIAAPKQRPQRKHGAKPHAAGSGSALGSGSAGSNALDSGSAAPSATGSASVPTAAGSATAPSSSAAAPISTGSAAGSDSAIAPLPAPAPPPAPTSLAMRDTSHGGAIADMDCKACHTSAGWKLGAGAGASGFDHDRTGFPLRGAHSQTTCGRCHTGTTTLQTTCAGCHRDPHQGRQGQACEECHTAVAWSDTNTLEQHRRTRMPLTGRHATVECVACHKRQSERTWSDVPVDCYACHRADYHRADVHPTHDGSSGSPAFSRDCGLCHQTSGWSPAVTDPSMLPRSLARADHDAVFQLSTGNHASAECTSCHVDARRTKLVRCDGCHQDVQLRAQHRGATVARGALSCLRCHPRGAAR